MSCKGEDGFDVNKLLSIWQKLLQEKETLGFAIGKVNAGMEFNLDAALIPTRAVGYFLALLGRWFPVKVPLAVEWRGQRLWLAIHMEKMAIWRVCADIYITLSR